MVAQNLEADFTKHLEGFDSMLTDPDLHPLAVEGYLSTDDGMEVELLDLWLPPLNSFEPSPQLPQQLSQTANTPSALNSGARVSVLPPSVCPRTTPSSGNKAY